MGLSLGWRVQVHFRERLSTQSAPPVEARLAPKLVPKLTKSRIFSAPGILSSSPLHTPRATPWHEGQMRPGSLC